MQSLQATGIASARTAEHVNANGELVVQGGANLASAIAGGLPTCGISSFSSDNAVLGADGGDPAVSFSCGVPFPTRPILATRSATGDFCPHSFFGLQHDGMGRTPSGDKIQPYRSRRMARYLGSDHR